MYRSDAHALTTSWQKYDMCFKFAPSTDAGMPNYINLRLDSWDGVSGNNNFTQIYFDRITLHPLNISLKDSNVDNSGPPYKLSDAVFGTYHT